MHIHQKTPQSDVGWDVATLQCYHWRCRRKIWPGKRFVSCDPTIMTQTEHRWPSWIRVTETSHSCQPCHHDNIYHHLLLVQDLLPFSGNWSSIVIPSMGLVYLPTFTIKKPQSCTVGKYTSPMDGMGIVLPSVWTLKGVCQASAAASATYSPRYHEGQRRQNKAQR